MTFERYIELIDLANRIDDLRADAVLRAMFPADADDVTTKGLDT